jgi:hypothetical protein
MYLDNIKVQRLSELLSISIAEVTALLTPPATNDTPDDNGDEPLAPEKCDDLSRQEIKQATTFDAAYVIFENAPANSELKHLALERCLSLCIDLQEAKTVYNDADSGSELQYLAIEKWLSFCTIFNEAYDAFMSTPKDNSELQRLALKKWLSLCTTSTEARTVHNEAEAGSELEHLALERWNDFSKQDVALVTTLDDAREAFENAPEDNNALQRLALKKCLSLCTTSAEAQDICDETPTDSEFERLALERLNVLFKQELEQATDFDEAYQIFENAPEDNNELELLALERCLSLCTDIDDAETIYDDTDSDSELELLVIKKWLALCTDIDDAQKIHGNAPANSEAERLALEKWNYLSKQAVEQAATLEDAEEVLKNTPTDSEAERLALEKCLALCINHAEAQTIYDELPDESEFKWLALERCLSLCTDIGDAQEVYKSVSSDSEAERLVVRRMYELV